MKLILKNYLQTVLRWYASRILAAYTPKIIGVTGSVGKTSTSMAIAEVLSASHRVRRNLKNYNNEIGIPLSIIGVESGGHSVLGWLRVFLVASRLLLLRDASYPEILVLELGADHPGDLAYLTSFVPLDVGVVTRVAPAHVEFFESIEHVAREKSTVVSVLSKTGIAILNADDPLVAAMASKTKARVVTYGQSKDAHVRASEVTVSHDVDYHDISTIQGVHFKVFYGGSTVPVLLPNVLGQHMVTVALAAIAVGLQFDGNLVSIGERLRAFTPPAGRMRLLRGIKNTLLIDDTYNSSPAAVIGALHQLSEIHINQGNRRYAVLGDMLELGNLTEPEHAKVGEYIAKQKIEVLVAVGERSRATITAAVKGGMSEEQCFFFADSMQAGRFLQDRIDEGDVLLIKGSQGMRMERVTKELMAEPERAGELLVRQDKSWQS